MNTTVQDRPSNIYDVARMAKVSTATVSFAMNGKGRVSRKTQDRVRAASKTLNYHPHPSARSLPRLHRGTNKRTATDLIAFNVVDFPGVRATYFDTLSGVTSRVWENRKMIIYQPIEIGREASFPWINRHGIDGRLLIGRVDDSVMDLFRAENVPTVILGDHQCQQPVWNINLDNHAVGRMMVDHLWKLGHRRFLFVSSKRHFLYQDEIKRGCTERLEERSATPASCLVVDQMELDVLQFEAIMTDPATRPTAVLTIEWECTRPILRGAQKLGLEAPRDFSLLAFGMLSDQKITVVDPCVEEMGRQGMDLLLRLIEQKHTSSPGRTLIGPTITEGETCGPPPSFDHPSKGFK